MAPEPTGLVFPGQGTQRPGMGAPWRDTPAWAVVDEVSECTGQDIGELLLSTPAEQLRRTDLAQLAVFSVAMMAHDDLMRRGRTDSIIACAGHSLGEYAAMVAAGALSLRDGAVLVAARGQAMRDAAQAHPGTMGVLVGAALADVEDLVRGVRESGASLWLANINAPGQVVVSGTEDGVERAALGAPGIGAKMIRVPVGGAFHSPFMASAAERLGEALKNVVFAPRHLPVVANVDAEPWSGDGDWADAVTRQLTQPVLWERSVRTLTERLGCRRLIELGPGRTLSGMIRRIDPGIDVVTVDGPGAP